MSQRGNVAYAGRPSVCRNCGALVGAGEQSCAQCGAASGGPVAEQPRYDREAMRFARAVLSRPYIFTIIFLVANIFVFLLMWLSGIGKDEETVLIAYGAKLNWLINAGQWWRFVTPIFIHIGIVHLLVNMYGLWMLGPYVERLYGSAKFVVFWVVSGIAGVVASYLSVRPNMPVSSLGRFLFRATDGPSAGASGALFGLVGVLFVFGIKFRRELPEGFKRAFGTGLLPIIFINLFIGYLGRGFIDNAAHIGGLVTGAALALLVDYKRPGEPRRVALFWHILQAAALLVVAASFTFVALHYSGPLPSMNNASPPGLLPNGNPSDVAANVEAINKGQTVFLKTLQDGDTSAIADAVKALESAPHLDAENDALRADLKELLKRAAEFASANNQQQQPQPRNRQQELARIREQRQLLADFEAWQKRRGEWVKTSGEKYGIHLEEPEPVTNSSPTAK